MAQSKKELVLAAMDGKPVDRVPVGFWFHFLKDEIHSNSFENPAFIDELFAGQSKYIDEHQPDFVKVMTDGFFPYTNKSVVGATSLEDLKNIQPLPDDDPWFTYQVEYAKRVSSKYGNELALFYNLFCAGTILKFMQPKIENGEAFLAGLVRENPVEAKHVLDVISGDVAKLAKRLITEGGVTGIYFSLQNLIGEGITQEVYNEVLAPSEKAVLGAANSVSDYNILHICGWSGHRNDLSWYKDYEVKTINWAAVVEDVTLTEGKKIFGGRTALGGFGNEADSLIYNGTEDEIKAETHRLLKEAGRTGIILGADCTVPRDTDWKHFEWVREAAAE